MFQSITRVALSMATIFAVLGSSLAFAAPLPTADEVMDQARPANLRAALGTNVPVIKINRFGGQEGEDVTASPSTERTTVIVDGILMDLPYWVVVGLIRNGTFRVVGELPIDIQWDVGFPADECDEVFPPPGCE